MVPNPGFCTSSFIWYGFTSSDSSWSFLPRINSSLILSPFSYSNVKYPQSQNNKSKKFTHMKVWSVFIATPSMNYWLLLSWRYTTIAKIYPTTIRIKAKIHSITISFFILVVIPRHATTLTPKLMAEMVIKMMPSMSIGSLYWEVHANAKNKKIQAIFPGVLE